MSDLLVTGAAEGAASMPDMSDYYLPNRLFLLLRFALWDEVLAEPAPSSKMIMRAALRHYARALAYASTPNLCPEAFPIKASGNAEVTIQKPTIWVNLYPTLLKLSLMGVRPRLSGQPPGLRPYTTVLRADARGRPSLHSETQLV